MKNYSPKHYYLPVDYSPQISDKSIGGTLAGTPPVFPCCFITFPSFRPSIRESVRRTTVLIFTHHQLAPSVGNYLFTVIPFLSQKN
jgi:hypothetical protein